MLAQKYIGTLTEKDGLLPARTKKRKMTGQLECCLSHFVIENFGMEIKRSFFNSGDFKDALLRAAVIGWMFGCVPQKRMIPLSASSIGFEEKMEKALGISEDRIVNVNLYILAGVKMYKLAFVLIRRKADKLLQ